MARKRTFGKPGRRQKKATDSLTPKQQAGLMIDVRFPKFIEKDGSVHTAPGRKASGSVAKEVGVTPQAVRKWRSTDPAYIAQFDKELPRHWSKLLEESWGTPAGKYLSDNPETTIERSLQQKLLSVKRKLLADPIAFEAKIKKFLLDEPWPGSIQMPDWPNVINTRDQLFDFYDSRRAVPPKLIRKLVDEGWGFD